MPLRVGIVNYGQHYIVDPVVRERVIAWQAAHTDMFIGGDSPLGHNPNVLWSGYLTLGGFYSQAFDKQYRAARLYCDSIGAEFENLLVHMRRNFRASRPWIANTSTDICVFGVFEGQNGVLSESGGALYDQTKLAYSTAGGVTFKDRLYLGYDVPFDGAVFTIQTPGVGYDGRWEYWNGTEWAWLSTATDATVRFTLSGNVSFVPPADWDRTSINGSWAKYFIRFNATSPGTSLKCKVRGDDWLVNDGSNNNCRGWDATSPTIINSGELAYNPTPPAHASARFRHQARATGYWGAGILYLNHAYKHNGQSVALGFKVQGMQEYFATNPYNAAYFDTLGGGLETGIVDPATNQDRASDFYDYTDVPWGDVYFANYLGMIDAIHAVNPRLLVGAGTPAKRYALESQWALSEYASPPCAFNGAMGIADSNPQWTKLKYDDLLPEHNPSGIFVLWQQQDILNHRPTNGGAFWDRSNRGPMVALSTHYLAANDKSIFAYYTQGGWRYDRTDEVFLWSDPTTLTQPLVRDVTNSVKQIKGADFSAFPAAGKRMCKVGNTVIVDDPNTNIGYTKIDNQTLETKSPIYYDVPAGASVRFMLQDADRLSNHQDYAWVNCDDVYMWANYFPAMYTDIGEPDPTGWNGGKRGVWSNTTPPRVVWRRDYTKAIVIYRMTVYNAPILWFDEYAEYELGGTYRSLSADGRLGEPMSIIRLRANEGAVLLKYTQPQPDPLAEIRRHLAAAKTEIEIVEQLLDEPIAQVLDCSVSTLNVYDILR